ncbi:PIN domain-containing protein [Tenacibaculum soleae]|uniref:PIN domain-containing protein n=1 Tax=Tenacibaculum soleae TaxID=447689 RepID=UPI0026E1BC8B|nr:PIN domain-containing protein [Tenacibaculum soleae]MDO6814006.1 PIN domain-containing protein [Tenacibaculum soleae]
MIQTDSLQIIEPDKILENIPPECKNIYFWDTCGLLDIFNLVIDSTNDSFIQTLKRIIAQIDRGEAISVSSVIVISEIKDNYPEPYGQADKLINETLKQYNKLMKYLVGLGMSEEASEISKNSIDLLPTLERIVQNLLNKTYFINDNSYLKLARDRVVSKVPPGIKNEFKDCVIWETCIDLSNYKVNGEKLFFISSNESDFGKNGKRFSKITEDCAEYSIDFIHKIHELYTHTE